MHLKTLTLRGFKSFASTTTINLEPGITCVVGPNGSGKSNVVDALAWVMGEQGAKNLRGGQMADVIFAGTAGRAPLGRAQVSLTIDNTDGALPIDYSEVTISRTLFRGGGSEYSINGTQVRLLDIQDLLSDTGMGRQMHVIVGQGQLDAILGAGPEERRGFIEEAAGVLKHRKRKERALRKLESMEGNLTRVRDLTNEIHRQLRPLAKQAETARRAGVIQAEVRDAQARLLADDLSKLKERLDAGKASEEAANARKVALNESLAAAKARLDEAEELARRGTPRTQELTRLWQELSTSHASLMTLSSVCTERMRAASSPIPAPNVDVAELDEKSAQANEEDARLLKEVEASGALLAGVIKQREEAEAAARSALENVRHLEAEQSNRREHIARLIGDVNAAEQALSSRSGEVERMKVAVEEAAARTAKAQEQMEGLEEVETGDEASGAHESAVRARDEARDLVDRLLAAEREAQSERATWTSRRDTLAQSLQPADETAELLGEEGNEVLGSLAGFISAQSGWENAVTALLDPFADAAVVASMQAALSFTDSKGRRRMVVAPERTATPAKIPGLTAALDVIECREEVRRLLEMLLAGAVVCESGEEAAKALQNPAVTKVATRRGDVFTPVSVLSGGSDHSSVLARHADFEDARSRAEAASAHLQEVSGQLAKAREAYDLALREANEQLRALRAADSERAKRMEARARASSQLRSAQGEEARLRAGLEKAQDGLERARVRLAEAKTKQVGAESLPQVADPTEARREADRLEEAAREARAKETATRLDIRTLEEQSRRARDRARSLRQQVSRARAELADHEKKEAARRREYARLSDVHARVAAPIRVAEQALEQASAELREAESERTEASEAAASARREVDELRASLLEVTDAAHRDEIALQEVSLRFEHTVSKAREELALEVDQLLEEFGPHNLIDAEEPYPYVRAEQEKRLRKAKRELERLGKINPLALEEHEALSKRHQFLVDQLRDLTESKNDLLNIVDEVDERVEEVFTQAFLDTQEAFNHVFATLFPGGSGRLVLTDPENMLETGVEIEARPAGKKITRLSLLSGGERSLAALALLIAIFKARPSPFYVLDEVEAALDDVNLTRLITIFKELQQDSQLIIITHQKRTMKIADALYGVTMRGGVTQVVSSKLADTKQARAEAALE
ncbi:MAG: chromosome segregation protein SMC [Actinomycetaceae bacterium]|nr:chromosome segregation protein SMC [Actinomycetaceae bacterium]